MEGVKTTTSIEVSMSFAEKDNTHPNLSKIQSLSGDKEYHVNEIEYHLACTEELIRELQYEATRIRYHLQHIKFS